jgi:hypothetical protein
MRIHEPPACGDTSRAAAHNYDLGIVVGHALFRTDLDRDVRFDRATDRAVPTMPVHEFSMPILSPRSKRQNGFLRPQSQRPLARSPLPALGNSSRLETLTNTLRKCVRDCLLRLTILVIAAFVGLAQGGSDELARELTTKRHLIALLYGQFSGATSLREIVTGLESHETRLYHLGAAPVKRSTMSDANSQRPWHVFAELATTMLMQETNDRGDNSHEGDRGDGPGCGNGWDDAGGAARAAGSDKRRRRSGSCVGIHLG